MTLSPYLVLARKYRPQRFADLTGQEHVVRTLSNALKTGRVAHAFLFTGPRGCGKTTSARILARALNCVGPEGTLTGPAQEPCGVCTPCLEIAQGNDVDVQEIDAASNNGVDDVRALREAARYLPARDRYKIYIVDEVHMLSGPAFNALLKTLEEPPGHIKFLLATTDPQKLPATILSRVQRHNFQLVPLGKIVTRLREIAQAEQVQVSDGALALVGRQAAGSMRDALSLLDQLFSAHDPAQGEIGDAEAAETLGALDRGVIADAISAVLRRDAGAALQAVVRAYEAGAEFKRLAEDLAAHARNLVLASLPASAGVKQDLPDHELRALAQEAARHDPAQLARVFELLQQAQDEVSKAATPRHALEVALLRAVHLAPAGSLPELVGRLEQLSARLGVGGAIAAGPGEGKPARPPPPWVSRGLPEGGAPLRSTVEPDSPAAPAMPAEAPERASSRSPEPAEAPPSVVAPLPTAAQPPTAAQHPTAAAPPAAASGPSGGAALLAAMPIEQRWKLLVESVRAARKVALAAVLEHAVPLEIGPAGVVIGVLRAQGRAGILHDRDNRAALEAAFERVLGVKVPLKIVDAPEAAPAAAGTPGAPASDSPGAAPPAPREAVPQSLAAEKQQARAQRSASRLAMGRDHPSVRAAVELLGGEIEDVKDLGEE